MKTSDIKIKPWLLPWLGEPDANEEPHAMTVSREEIETVIVKCRDAAREAFAEFAQDRDRYVMEGPSGMARHMLAAIALVADSYPRDAAESYSQGANEAYPSTAAMKAAVELEILSALGRVHTVKIGELIQKIIDADAASQGENKSPMTDKELRGRLEDAEASSGVEPINYDELARNGKDKLLRGLATIVMSEQTGSRSLMSTAEDALKEIIRLRASPPPSASQASCSPPENNSDWRSFDTTGTVLRRVGNALTITCETDQVANRVADQLRTPAFPREEQA